MHLASVDDVQAAVGDRYEIVLPIGVGGMGAVFLGRHGTLGNLVAVKVLDPEVATSEMRRRRFEQEARLAAHLSHDYIVPVVDYGVGPNGLPYLVMPYVRGPTLEAVLHEKGPLPVADVLRLAREIGDALGHAHRSGVVHRDVKPANILVEESSGRYRLTDFGVARTADSSLTVPGAAIGTPAYMAPEQAYGEDQVDGRADLYALGVVIYEALRGKPPPLRADLTSLARSLREARRSEISSSLARALVRPLAELPTERPASAGVWLDLVERARRARRVRRLIAAGGGAAALVTAWLVQDSIRTRAPANPTVAVMPFTVLGSAPYAASQLPEYFLARFSPVDDLRDAMSYGRVAARAGARALSTTDADAVASALGATYFVQASVAFAGDSVTLSATLYETGRTRPRGRGESRGPAGAITDVMDAVWAQILGSGFAPQVYGTLPRGKDAIAAYLNADAAFRRGDYDGALAAFDRVIAADSAFALARFRRALVIAQVDATGERIREALQGALRHQSGLSPADSLMLEGYAELLQTGDGTEALRRFQGAATVAPDEPLVWFVLGEFYTHFGALFDQPIGDAWIAFNRALDLVPSFAPAIAHLISLAYQRGDQAETRRLMDAYRRLDSTSVVARVVGIADTVLFGAPSARLHLINNTLDERSFEVLAFLAFQAAGFGGDADRQGPGRRVLLALERRASNPEERSRALRLGLAADLRYGWVDSARARLLRAPAGADERDRWALLAPATGLPALGDPGTAASRLASAAVTQTEGDAVRAWLLARSGPGGERARFAARLEQLAGGGPLPRSLSLDLSARAALARGDTAGALERWDRATRRYAVLRVPFDLVASLWPLRLDLARVATAARDTARAVRACRGFDAPIGYVDQVALGEAQRLCAPWRAIDAGI